MEYSKCLVQVDEILNYLKPEDLKKIPEDIRKIIKESKDENYAWKYDEGKNLEKQNLNRKSIAILAYLNTEYLLNDEQRKLMKQVYKNNEEELEEEKRKRYNPDCVFENSNNMNINTKDSAQINEKVDNNSYKNNENQKVENDNTYNKIVKVKWYNKIILYIKSLFSKKSWFIRNLWYNNIAFYEKRKDL